MTDPTRFDLDERQRAMLAEMGVRVWWPQRDAATASGAGPLQTAAEPVTQAATAVVPSFKGGDTRAAPLPRPTPLVPSAPVVAAVSTDPGLVPLPAGVDEMDWATLQATVAGCRACGLCQTRKHTVFGVGERAADWMVIGEAPGENEDLQGEPFVGQAGKLLDNMLQAIGLSRQTEGRPEGMAGVYITNTLKCRPPGNRNPEPQELQTCAPFLARQVALVKPKIILAMGRFAVQSLLQTTEPIGRLRGRVHPYQGVPVVVTYHPAYLLRNPPDKAKAWADLCLALQTAPSA